MIPEVSPLATFSPPLRGLMVAMRVVSRSRSLKAEL